MNNGLVICHGRLHKKIHELNYETTTFMDVDDKNAPDYILSIKNPETPLKINRTFPFIINAFCPQWVVFRDSTSVILDPFNNTIDGELSDRYFHNIRDLLQPDGIYYTVSRFDYYDGSSFSHVPNLSLFRDKMFRFGFRLVETNITFTFGEIVRSDFIYFQKVDLPTKTDMLQFLQERMRMEPPIKYIQLYMQVTNIHNVKTTTVRRIYISDSDSDFDYINDDVIWNDDFTYLTITTTDDCTTRLI